MHLLDADTLTHLHAGHPTVVQRLRQCDDPVTAVTIFTKAEVLRARCEFLLKAAGAEQIMRAMLGNVPGTAYVTHSAFQ